MEQPGKDDNAMGSPPAIQDNTAMTPSQPVMNPQELYMKMGELGMQAEQKQFEQDIMQLQASLSGKGDDVMNQYDQLRKKGVTTSAISTAAGAIAGGLAGLLFSRRKPNWGTVKKSAVAVGGGFVGAGIASVLTGLPMRKQAEELQRQAEQIGATQADALQGIMDKYTTMVKDRMGTAQEKLKPNIPEEPGEPPIPESLTQDKARKTAPSALLHNASANPLIGQTRSVS